MKHNVKKYQLPEDQPELVSEPDYSYISIPLPLVPGIDVSSIKKKVIDYAKRLVEIEIASYNKPIHITKAEEEDLAFLHSLQFDTKTEVPADENVFDAIVEQKYMQP